MSLPMVAFSVSRYPHHFSMLTSAVRSLSAQAPELLADVSPHKIVSWNHIYMIHAALRVQTTSSSLERFIKPFHYKLIANIAYSLVPAFSTGGKVPDIFSQPRQDLETCGPLGSYMRLSDILQVAQQIGLPSTTVSSPRYRGGDMYMPLLTSLKDANDYTGFLNQNLLPFNIQPLWEEQGESTSSSDSGPDKLHLSPP